MKENQHIEWKESWRDEYLKWISGFANAEGGVLVIGRNDKGKVVGVPNARKLLVDLPNKVRDLLGIVVAVNLKRTAGKDTIEIAVEPYPYPVSYKGEYHVRSGSTKQELKGAALDRFLLHRQGKRWDGVPVPQVTARELSKPALDSFRRQARQSRRLGAAVLRESTRGLIEKLHLVDGTYLKRAALLLFHADPEQFVTGAFVKIGFFRTNADLLYHDEVHGDLFAQVEKTMDLLLTKYLIAAISYEGIQRVETLPVPEDALREALLNALIHKDYASGTPIQISVYHDKLMLWNPGELPPDWTVAKLKAKHASRPFNPDVANAFFRAGMIEGASSSSWKPAAPRKSQSQSFATRLTACGWSSPSLKISWSVLPKKLPKKLPKNGSSHCWRPRPRSPNGSLRKALGSRRAASSTTWGS